MPDVRNRTRYLQIPKEGFETGIADAYTFNAAMDWIDGVLYDGTYTGDVHWKKPVANYAALPVLYNSIGDVRLTLDTLTPYVWTGASWSELNKAVVYRGVWNANANLPPLASGTGVQGEYYVVGVSGNTNLDGITDWVVGDWAIFNGTVWEKADHTDVVTSVFGRQGPVVAVAGDYDFPKITGTITDLQHGNRSGGTLHPGVTPNPGGVAGFMDPADKAKLNGIAANAARVQDYQFGRNVQVPGGGVLGFYGPGNTLVGVRMNRAGVITGASIQVDVVDGARDYNLVIYKNGGRWPR
jgi:hypothetical protein